MATFVSLITLTQHGEEDVGNSLKRANAFRDMAERTGALVKDIYWTVGHYDGVVIFDAPDDETAAALLLSLGSKGTVRSQTLRAFDSDQISTILDRLL